MLRAKPLPKVGQRPNYTVDWYVKVIDYPELDKTHDSRKQCRAYKAYVETLGYEAEIYRRTYTSNKYEGGFINSEEVVR